MEAKCVGECCESDGWVFDCPCCEGSGTWETEQKCSTCGGTGRMWTPRATCKPVIDYPPMYWLDVEQDISDPLAPEACPRCGGDKVLLVPRTGQKVRCSCVAMKCPDGGSDYCDCEACVPPADVHGGGR